MSGVLSISDSGRRVPAEYGEESHASSSVDASRLERIEEGLSRSLSGGGGKPSFPSPSAGDLKELPRVPLRGEGSTHVVKNLPAMQETRVQSLG